MSGHAIRLDAPAIPRPLRGWSDGGVAAAAAVTAVGAWWARRLPWVLVAPVCLIALRSRRLVAIAGAAALVASLLGARSLAGLHPGERGEWTGHVSLVSDPQWRAGEVQAFARVRSKRMLVSARGPTAAALSRRSAGERVTMTGRVSAIAAPKPWMVARHIAGRFAVVSVGRDVTTPAMWRVANALRRTLLRGAAVLPRTRRGLFGGFVLGDVREQTPEAADDFRAAGLTHLLVVSGQNVAFTLAAVEPVLRRLRRRARLVMTGGVLLLFAAVTRFEPSVLRASAMAAVTVLAGHLGRPQRSLRVLGLATIALLLVDPLLIRSLGFGLSLGACLGIALLDRPLRAALPGPAWLRGPLATTLAAQAGTIVLLSSLTGGFVLASVPANLLAVPVAEPVMVWGVAAGLPAGLLGHRVATILHVPTSAGLWWVAGVARRIGRVPLGTIGGSGLVVMVVAASITVASRARRVPDRPHRSTPRIERVAALVTAVLLASPAALAWRGRAATGAPWARGLRVWTTAQAWPSRRADVVVLVFGADAASGLAALRRHGVDAVDLVVVAGGGRPQGRLLDALARRVRIGAVLAADRSFAGSVRPVIAAAPESVVRAGHHVVRIGTTTGGRLDVQVEVLGGARPPPIRTGSR